MAALLLAGCSQNKQEPLKVGVSTSYSESSGRASVGSTYIESLRRGGHVPYILPLVHTQQQAEQTLANLDVLLLTGGEDIDPVWYGEESIGDCVEINAPRDTSDILYARAALKRGMKILAICRGEQVLNVAMGGTLYQDLPSQYEGVLQHRQGELDIPGTVASQTITIEPDSKLHELIGADTVGVNSFHHEAVKDIAPGLRVVARTSDGVIEAYEGKNILATQFHPEIFTKAGDDTFLKIFQLAW